MDPLTLFALANGAVSAIKAGCKLYKDIKGAAGDVKEVLKDLDEQFHGAYSLSRHRTGHYRPDWWPNTIDVSRTGCSIATH